MQVDPSGEATLSGGGLQTSAFVSIQKRASNQSPLNTDLQLLLKDKQKTHNDSFVSGEDESPRVVKPVHGPVDSSRRHLNDDFETA